MSSFPDNLLNVKRHLNLNLKKITSELKPWPTYIQERLQIWDKLYADYEAELQAKTPEPIKVTLPDGKVVEGESWRTTPYQVAQDGLAGSKDGRSVVENVCGVNNKRKTTISELGFLKRFNGNVSKRDSVGYLFCFTFRCGPLIDLCRGPHVRHTGKVKALQVVKNSATYWEGKSDAESLQRIYGISFPDNKQLKEWQKFQEEAAKRDHRKIGKEQELFFFHELSPGSCFFQPKGAHIYNELIAFIKDEYRKRGFQEVVSPNVYNSKLWETSGHWQHYADNMFSFEVEKQTFALKPMNCPGHCLIFDHRPRSWRELPLRLADFGVLHRNEISGALTGLTRVRRFQQDDAHIFCTQEQITAEINGALDFLKHVYGVLGFTFQLKLSTRPENFLGEIEMWDNAEKQLAESLDAFGQPWSLNPGDGAFYGPKIDITITDALRRPHQCATIQLDFQLPIRFNLQYDSVSGEKKRPVIIHRAILGSVERMIAILTESFGGKWPFWLSPRQSIVVPVGPMFEEYAQKVCHEITSAGFICDMDVDQGDTMKKKIRNAQLEQYNFIFVVGEREKTSNTVNVRTRDDNAVRGEFSIADVINKFKILKEKHIPDSDEIFPKSNTEGGE
ncbi:threonine--tRNA ligase 1, cytoplasmic [Caerostris darwini]|uniref:threonine--tRNA ligase n=1 Tax=Caerostris darwini TaxID=1538125 RepID=A0AAV4W7Q4_9ARAC|nr:threonine--tRNA ligase 1, cytoplasmic [Caerostris darwini]